MYVQNAKCVLGQILRLKSLDVKPIRLSAKGALFCGKKNRLYTLYKVIISILIQIRLADPNWK